MKKLIVVLAAIAILSAMVVPTMAAGTAPKAYADAKNGDLLYTVDFRADNGVIDFGVLADSKAGELFTYTPSADGTALDVKGVGTGTAGCLWGGTIDSLVTGKGTIYTMTYQATTRGNQGTNNSVGVGGYFSGGNGASMLNFYSNYNTEQDGNTSMRRGVLQAGSTKINDASYTYFNTLSKNVNVDKDGYVTCMVVFDGKNAAISAYVLAEGATDQNKAESWILVATQVMIPTDGCMGFGLYTYYPKNIDATIKNVKFYKGMLTSNPLADEEANQPTPPAPTADGFASVSVLFGLLSAAAITVMIKRKK